MGDFFANIPFVSEIFGLETDQEKWARENMESATGLSDLLSNITRQYYTQTGPVRDAIIKRAQDIMAGNFSPSSSPLFGPAKQAVEDTYGTARENIMSQIPSGGRLYDELSNLESNRAKDLAGTMANILNQEYSNAFNLGTSSIPMTMSGFNAASTPLNTANAAMTGNLAAQNSVFGMNDFFSDISKYMGQAFANYAGSNSGAKQFSMMGK